MATAVIFFVIVEVEIAVVGSVLGADFSPKFFISFLLRGSATCLPHQGVDKWE